MSEVRGYRVAGAIVEGANIHCGSVCFLLTEAKGRWSAPSEATVKNVITDSGVELSYSPAKAWSLNVYP